MSKFLGGLAVAVGVLLAGTTGLCTGVVIFSALPGLIKQPGAILSMAPFLLVGIVPCALGVYIARLGLNMMRAADED